MATLKFNDDLTIVSVEGYNNCYYMEGGSDEPLLRDLHTAPGTVERAVEILPLAGAAKVGAIGYSGYGPEDDLFGQIREYYNEIWMPLARPIGGYRPWVVVKHFWNEYDYGPSFEYVAGAWVSDEKVKRHIDRLKGDLIGQKMLFGSDVPHEVHLSFADFLSVENTVKVLRKQDYGDAGYSCSINYGRRPISIIIDDIPLSACRRNPDGHRYDAREVVDGLCPDCKNEIVYWDFTGCLDDSGEPSELIFKGKGSIHDARKAREKLKTEGSVSIYGAVRNGHGDFIS